MEGALQLGVGANLVAFAGAALVTRVAGHVLTRDAKGLADRTRLGSAFLGTVLLGVVVSLPELTLSAVAAALGRPELALNSLLGGVAFTMVILAVTDAWVGAEPLSVDVTHPVVLLEGALTLVMTLVAAAGMTAGEVPLLGAGAWSTALAAAYALTLLLVWRLQRKHPWRPGTGPRLAAEVDEAEEVRRLGGLLTAIYLAGLVARPRGAILRMGPDSIAVLAVAAVGLIVLVGLA